MQKTRYEPFCNKEQIQEYRAEYMTLNPHIKIIKQ